MKQILIITYYFPPHGGIGVLRVSKMCKYLPTFGWNPMVLTVERGQVELKDQSFSEQLPEDLEVHFTPRCNPFAFLENSSNRLFEPGNVRFSDYLLLPDNKLWWLPELYKAGRRILKRRKIDAVLVTMPPFSAALKAKQLAREFNKPLILDYRDSWNNNPLRPTLPPLHQKINAYLERSVLKNTSLVTAVTPHIIRTLEHCYNGATGVIPNGYDPDDFKTPPDEDDNTSLNLLRIKHVGSVYSGINYPRIVLKALSELEMAEQEHLHIEFIGKHSSDLLYDRKKFRLQNIMQLTPYIKHEKAVKKMQEADLLLLYIDPYKKNLGHLSGKLMEYIGAGTPILGVVPYMSLAGQLIRKHNLGLTVSSNAPEKLKNTIRLLIKQKKNEALRENTIPPVKYDIQRLIGELAELLNSLPK